MISKEDAQYIVDVILPRRELMIKRDRLDDALKYANMLSGQNVSSPGCSCEFTSYWFRAYSIIDQYMDVVRAALEIKSVNKTSKKVKGPKGI